MEKEGEILRKIHSNDPEQIEEAIQAVKESGDMAIAGAILGQLEQISGSRTMTSVVSLLADIRESGFRDLVIRQLEETGNPATQCQLLRIIWESSLDYSAHLNLFMQILAQAEFAVAFEASTVIESMVGRLDRSQKEELHRFISGFDKDKFFLVENIHEEMHHCEDEEEDVRT